MAPKSYANGVSPAYPRHNKPRRLPIRIIVLAFICSILFLSSIFSIPTSTEDANSTKDAANHFPVPTVHRPKLPKIPDMGMQKIHSLFRPAAHEPPPVQRNSTSGEAKWFSDYKWLIHPFSSSITLDENRSVLPPLQTRPPIYTYYDTDAQREEDVRIAENKLLLIWRRAWWAKGFRPVILGKGEAMGNPLYEKLQVKKLDPAVQGEMMRWLAWGHMGAGILANWLVLPMGPYDDHLLSFLRRGQYPRLTRYEELVNGLFSGDQTSVDAAVSVTISSGNVEKATSFLDAVSDPDVFAVDPKPSSIAYYSMPVLAASYQPVVQALEKNQSNGLALLAQLINSHLHITFLNTFTTGIAIISPDAEISAVLASPALSLASSLTSCYESPMPKSCPPNAMKCKPCTSIDPLPTTYPSSFLNTSTLYSIGTIPHPYTLASFRAGKSDLTAAYIRRETSRDPWLQIITKDTLSDKISGPARISRFKEAIASEFGAARGIWSTGENEWDARSIEWHFGFELPKPLNSTDDTVDDAKAKVAAVSVESGKKTTVKDEDSISTVAASKGAKQKRDIAKSHRKEPEDQKKAADAKELDGEGGEGAEDASNSTPSNKNIALEKALEPLLAHLASSSSTPVRPDVAMQARLLDNAKDVIRKSEDDENRKEGVKEMVEAWNLADTEAWRFVRAYVARERVERLKWEEEERRFVGSEEGMSKEGWGRWFD
ncbi:hypothetical protein MMC09_003899 [Bachmanniomyces sp. S44760]|nr:hypothetical protein [Bachmanniomyces sp. S44760]